MREGKAVERIRVGDLNESSRFVECEGHGSSVHFRLVSGDAVFGVAVGGADLWSRAFGENSWYVNTDEHRLVKRDVVTASRGGSRIAENTEVVLDWTIEPKVRFSERPPAGDWETLFECDTGLSAADFARLLPFVGLWWDGTVVEIVDD